MDGKTKEGVAEATSSGPYTMFELKVDTTKPGWHKAMITLSRSIKDVCYYIDGEGCAHVSGYISPGLLHKILAKVAPLAEFKWLACAHDEKNAQNGHDSHYNNGYYHHYYNYMYDPRSLYDQYQQSSYYHPQFETVYDPRSLYDQYQQSSYYHPQFETETHPHSSFHTPSQPPVVDKQSSGEKAVANPDQTKKPHAKKFNKFFKLMLKRFRTVGVRIIKAFIS
ncbi:uncharacterized protein LOC115957934 [Quercus lobata]|uniref:uncharacterized protein LOC115957934 n=1 Tax=Quercus lobata TaxID=97700 RepID=UPI001246EB68|nr:uncharacterized protein LOC115957934 [Quercus lobata]XP_030932143.1 uncharacterized protein LOC115957934 [Quercus lobata]